MQKKLYGETQRATAENKMSDVVKTHRLNTAIQAMSLTEIRIMQLAIVDARETGKGLNADTPLRIKVSRYSEVFKVSMSTAYESIMSAEKTLFNRQFSFIDDKRKVKSRWIQQVIYDEGAIEIIFTTAVIKEITRIDGIVQKNLFSKYALEQTVLLKSGYSVRLYELLAQWITAKKTPVFELETFRGQLGLADNEYKAMSDFKRRILDLAVKEINEKTDLIVSYEQEKDGKTVTGFKFKVFKNKKVKACKKDELEFKELTAKQINFYASKLANHGGFGSANGNVGENALEFEDRIKMMLKDTANQKKWMKDLEFVGFNARQ